MKFLTWQNPEQLFVAQALKKQIYNRVAELRIICCKFILPQIKWHCLKESVCTMQMYQEKTEFQVLKWKSYWIFEKIILLYYKIRRCVFRVKGCLLVGLNLGCVCLLKRTLLIVKWISLVEVQARSKRGGRRGVRILF